MTEAEMEQMIANSRQLIVSLIQPNGEEESYCYLVDTPGLCTKIVGDVEELVNFDFIPEWVIEAVCAVIQPK